MAETVFEEEFNTFNPDLWEVKGDHENFNYTVSDSWIHLMFQPLLTQPGRVYRWASVSSRAPFDLTNRVVELRFDLLPKKLTYELPMFGYYIGVMLANKKDIVGHPMLTPDVDLQAVAYLLQMFCQTPQYKFGFVIDRGTSTSYTGGIFVSFPPSTYQVRVGLTKVITYEEGIEDLTLPLPFDPTRTYIHLLVLYTEVRLDGHVAAPSRGSFDFLRILTSPTPIEYPKPETVVMSQVSSVLPVIMAVMLITMLMSMLRGVMRG
ncbi:MAG: hypothetical protein QXZ68_04755 [Candidatus Bathyarchaeia archaeon]